MKSHAVSPIVKLQNLRLLKDVFISAEFNFIESLDEEIEEHVFQVAAYNLTSKKS